MSKMGIDPLRIANRLHVSEEEVKTLIEDFESRRLLASSEIVDWLTNVEGLIAVDGAGMDIQAARQALRFTGRYDSNNEPIYERDWNTTLEAIDRAVKMVEVAKPKGGKGDINIGINAGTTNVGVGQVKTFEQRVREKRGVLDDGDVKFLSDGQGNEVVDVDAVEAGDDDDELADEMMDGTTEAEIEKAEEAE